MAATYRFPIIQDCSTCPLRHNHLFCNLSDAALNGLQAIKSSTVHPKGAVIGMEGQPPRGVFILCEGRAKLTTSSPDGKSAIFRVAEPGEVLGISSVLSGAALSATIETLDDTQATFIPRADFLQYLDKFPEARTKVTEQLVHNCKCAYKQIRWLALSSSVPEKVAQLLLNWADHPLLNTGSATRGTFRVTLTQEEIAQIVGASRESVSRALNDFKRKGWLRADGAIWRVADRKPLEAVAKIS